MKIILLLYWQTYAPYPEYPRAVRQFTNLLYYRTLAWCRSRDSIFPKRPEKFFQRVSPIPGILWSAIAWGALAKGAKSEEVRQMFWSKCKFRGWNEDWWVRFWSQCVCILPPYLLCIKAALLHPPPKHCFCFLVSFSGTCSG